MKLILASNSPRRRQLLSEAGFTFEITAPNIEEVFRISESPKDFAKRMAREKIMAVLPLYEKTQALILAADTIVTIDGIILGKPKDGEDATKMLDLLSGRTHEVITGWALARSPFQNDACLHIDSEITRVTFRALTHEEISTYIATPEPYDKAGSYAIQENASSFVTQIDGNYENVVGLPIQTIIKKLHELLTNR